MVLIVNITNTHQLRKHHPAWQLLAATKGPQVISVLQELFKHAPDGVEFDDAVLNLAQQLQDLYQNGELEYSADFVLDGRREIRQWIKRGLLLERQGKILATDALESTFRFVQSLDQRIMSSSASRLAIVQREIEHLEASLNSDPEQRANFLKSKIKDLQDELKTTEEGHVEVISEDDAIESIREIYSLSASLSHDFRRVEDSYREADQRLRKSIISEQHHRGNIVDKMLDSHEALLETPEGKVFNGFHQQLIRTLELEKTKQQLRTIAAHPSTQKALSNKQQSDLRWMIMRLLIESERVVKARARSEKDVRGFLQTGLASEHHRMGQMLNEFFAHAMTMDWSKQALRRTPALLPPIAVNNNNLPLVERIRFKEIQIEDEKVLDLLPKDGALNELDDDFWDNFDGMDQEALLLDTTELLAKNKGNMTIAQIAEKLPPSHDLEAISLWLSMAMASDTVKQDTELVDIKKDGSITRFTIPKVELNNDAVNKMEFEI